MNVHVAKRYNSRYDLSVKTKHIGLTPDRLDRLAAYFRHGYLSTEMLHAIADPDIGQKYTTEEVRRFKQYPNSYLEVPIVQKDAYDARSNRLIARLNDKATEMLVLKNRISDQDALIHKKLRQNNPHHFWHDVATGYITGSFELGARELGLQYLSVYDILKNAPAKTLEASNPLAIPYKDGFIVPDALFGISDGEQATYFVLETDMGTEQGKHNAAKHSTLEKKYLAYRNMWRLELYKSLFGIPNLKLLLISTRLFSLSDLPERFRAIAQNDRASSGLGPIYIRSFPPLDFQGTFDRPYSGFMLTEPWQRLAAPDTLLYKKRPA